MIRRPAATAALVDRVMHTCGGGRVLCVSPDPLPLVSAFRRRAIEALPYALSPRSFVWSLPAEDAACDIVVADGALEALDDAMMARGIAELLRVTRGALVVIARDRSRTAVERAWLAHACRKHPLHQLLVPFEGLDWERGESVLLFEPLPAGALTGRAVADLHAGRDLHMDMLREAGRRADAHVARYMFARRFIRAGDRVLDAACGLGYGAAILADGTLAESVRGLDNDPSAITYATEHYGQARSRLTFETNDVMRIADLAAGSVDAVVSFETIEHISDPDAFLEACRRVLTPAGRIIGSVPNAWVNQAGLDPNPHHLHVFDRSRLEQLYARHFFVERVFGQTAGGGMKLPESGRTLWDAQSSTIDAEWWLAVGMKDPEQDATGPVRHGLIAAKADDRTNVLAFDRDYSNPWLVRAMVTIGLRAQSDVVLARLADRALAAAPPESPDAGAALCVQAYRALEQGAPPSPDLRAGMTRYITRPSATPHARRWQISLMYVDALASLLEGDLGAAARALEMCTLAEALHFSPLLATKTVGAAFLRGWIALQAREWEQARRWWTIGVEQAEAALHRPWSDFLISRRSPALFGLREATVIVDLASQCATGLALIDQARERPGLVASQIFESLQERARSASPVADIRSETPVDPVPAIAFSWSLLNHLDDLRLREGDPSQVARWDLPIDDTLRSMLFLHPPGVADITIPCGDAGQFRTEVSLHPDTWDKPGATACVFSVCLDHVVAGTVRLDPHQRAADRRWVNIALDVPASATGTHLVTLETRGPEGTDFGWALFKDTTFVSLEKT